MKIKQITGFPLEYPEPHYKGTLRYITLARVETDDGVVGWGECISQFPESALATKVIIERGFAPLLEGETANDVERLWRKMLDHVWWIGPEGIAAFAISAIDMALWDVKGKAMGMPVSKLIGGQLHAKVPAMASVIFDIEDIDATEREFAWMCDQGYDILKGGWGMHPGAVFGDNRERDLELVRRLRDVVGRERQLVVDTPGVWGLWDVPTAIRRFHDLEEYNLFWIEQPLLPSDYAGHARLRAAVSIPIGTGEDEWNVESYKRLIDSCGVDIIQFDPGRCHGITGVRDAIKLVEASNLQYSMHTWSSALNTAASLHLMAISNHGVCKDFKPHESPMQHELVSDPWEQQDGYIAIRDKPGLGVEVREEIVQKYLFS
ncbi:MAG: mandelate racemase/muconate lactonizing enzyme family protein [Anaerolineales bacterium]|jgi:L-alanine-DL-glutamate epimerase-like enolase superfamily enzyme|nr:mandelate racemase/muconate lactonizing enzyme family protein [Anaerolineales bacterium]HJL69929.1 mandelate racemase/muconate lactonizing enzyme family protein [Anaerolineales bacterium]|tara:strand:- start:1054 stop:2181 length:1128 start_codon:yes stop_codon:yes gene_type:complete